MTEPQQDTSPPGQWWPIETEITIGVTGHREFVLSSSLQGAQLELLRTVTIEMCRSAVQEVLHDIDKRLAHTPHTYTVLSPLAEGADRLVVQEVLAWPNNPKARNVQGAGLRYCPPMPEEEYLKTFTGGADSLREYYALKKAAVPDEGSPHQQAGESSHAAAYRSVGRHVVDHCDILIAIWDGESGRAGGTAEVVQYARDCRRPLYWVHQPRRFGRVRELLRHIPRIQALSLWQEDARQTGRFQYIAYIRHWLIRKENVRTQLFILFRELDGYNGEVQRSDTTDVIRRYDKLLESAGDAPFAHYLGRSIHDQFVKYLLPHLSAATTLASRYQNLYMRSGTAVYILAACAVVTVTLIIMFFERYYWLFWLEVAEIGSLLILLLWTSLYELHRKWIDYRFLAERLRAAVFLFIAGMKCDVPATPAFLALSHRPGYWISKAFVKIWSRLHPVDSAADGHLEALVRFERKAWIEDQIAWYRERRENLERSDHRLGRTGEVLFMLTLVAALLHAWGIGHASGWSKWLSASAIILPAAGAACSGIRIYREFRRNAERYGNLAIYLSSLKTEMGHCSDIQQLHSILQKADHAMLREHQGWRASIGIPPPPPA